jgi:hypothetical protein
MLLDMIFPRFGVTTHFSNPAYFLALKFWANKNFYLSCYLVCIACSFV